MTTMRDRFYSVTEELLATNECAALVLADIGAARLRTALDRYPGRATNVGIREQAMVGVAAGLAMEGFRPILHSYAPFLVERTFEQLKLDLSHQGVGAILASVGASYDWAEGGRTHQAPGDVAVLDTLPGWNVHVPGHPDEVEMLLRYEMDRSGPAYIRLGSQSNARATLTQPGRFVPLRTYDDAVATIVAVGPFLDRTVEAVRDLRVNVVYAATVRPFDSETLLRVAGSQQDVILVEPYLAGTSIREVTETRGLSPRVLGLGVPRSEFRRYGNADEHDAAHGLDAAGIRRSVVAFLDERAPVLS